MAFVTTNIRLPEWMLRALKIKAAKENKSVAQLIRESAEYILGRKEEHITNFQFKKDPFWKIVGMFDDGIKDGSIHHDRDIY